MNGIETLVRDNIRSLCPYSTARDEYEGSIGVFLDANESPYANGFNRYPDPRQKRLKERVSQIKAVPVESVFLGNGSDEGIDLMYRIFCEPGVDNAVMISPSYGMYSVAAAINGVEVRSVPLGPDFSLPVDSLLAACDRNTKLMFLCSPNNPSGNAFTQSELLALVRSFGGIVVLDEAYVDFSDKGSLLRHLRACPNLVILQTLSKAWGMAGLRLGIAFAHPYVISLMNMVKYPYNICQLTQDTVLRLLDSSVDENTREIIEQREELEFRLKDFSSVKMVFPSDANFLLVRVDDADRMYSHLLRDGIIVRNRNKLPGCENCLRLTVGLAGENARLIESLEEYESLYVRCE